MQGEARLAQLTAPSIWCIWNKRRSNRDTLSACTQRRFPTWLRRDLTLKPHLWSSYSHNVLITLPVTGFLQTGQSPPPLSHRNGVCWRRDGSGGGGGGGGVSIREGWSVVSGEGRRAQLSATTSAHITGAHRTSTLQGAALGDSLHS